MTKGSLAVIIPAYKSEFLDKTLDSLDRQTDKNFTVYIGDDASPYPIWNTVSRWTGRLKIIYRRFEDNLGGTSLTAHWNRCLDMIADEEFFCMFSDDDIMEENCVAAFRKALKKYPNHDVYHFDISIIRSDGSLDRECNSFPAEIAADEFFARLYMKEIDARMPEFIFRTDNFRKCGGFVEFKKAFRSDNATVMTCAAERSIRTTSEEKARILWRESGINVSCIKTAGHLMELSDANIAFFSWTHRHFRSLGKKYPLPIKVETISILYLFDELKAYFDRRTLFQEIMQYKPGMKDMKYRLHVLGKFIFKYMIRK